MPEPPTELDRVNHHSADEVVEDLLPDKECDTDTMADDVSSTREVPMDCSVTMNLASGNESVHMEDSSTVLLIRHLNIFAKSYIFLVLLDIMTTY